MNYLLDENGDILPKIYYLECKDNEEFNYKAFQAVDDEFNIIMKTNTIEEIKSSFNKGVHLINLKNIIND